MSQFYITLICHAEHSSASEERKYEWSEWVPNFLSLLDVIEEDTGCHIPVTWCPVVEHRRERTTLIVQEIPDIWQQIKDRGDEIGLHIHVYPEVDGKDERFGWYVHELQHLFLEEDVDRLVHLGFEPPKTYVPGMQLWRKEWASALLKAGFEVSSTIMALPSKYVAWLGLFEHFDIAPTPYLLWHHRPESYPFRPYRTQNSNLVAEGDSELVELPVIGWIGCDIYPDAPYFENSPPFDTLAEVRALKPKNWIAERFMKFEADEGKPFPGLYERWRRRKEVPVDIWPTLFHPRELHEENIQRMNKFIRALLEWDDVSFATAHEAVLKWKAGTIIYEN